MCADACVYVALQDRNSAQQLCESTHPRCAPSVLLTRTWQRCATHAAQAHNARPPSLKHRPAPPTCSSFAICPCASAMLDLTGLSRMACVAGLGRYSRILDTAAASGPPAAMAAFTRPTISPSLAVEAKAWGGGRG